MKKKVLCLVFAVVSLMLVSAIYAEEGESKSVLVNPPTVATAAPVSDGMVLFPVVTVRRSYYAVPFVKVVPVQPTLLFAAPIKPLFSTPFRDSWFYGKYNRDVRQYNKYSRRLAVPIIVQPEK